MTNASILVLRILLGGITGCFALALLMVVMRGRLRQATDMDEFMQVVA